MNVKATSLKFHRKPSSHQRRQRHAKKLWHLNRLRPKLWANPSTKNVSRKNWKHQRMRSALSVPLSPSSSATYKLSWWHWVICQKRFNQPSTRLQSNCNRWFLLLSWSRNLSSPRLKWKKLWWQVKVIEWNRINCLYFRLPREIERANKSRGFSLTESQVTIEQTTVVTTNEVEVTTETVVEEEQKPVEPEDPTAYHITKDVIEEYEESQAAFRELWEKKREKVRFVWFDFLFYDFAKGKLWAKLFIAFTPTQLSFLSECCFASAYCWAFSWMALEGFPKGLVEIIWNVQ